MAGMRPLAADAMPEAGPGMDKAVQSLHFSAYSLSQHCIGYFFKSGYIGSHHIVFFMAVPHGCAGHFMCYICHYALQLGIDLLKGPVEPAGVL